MDFTYNNSYQTIIGMTPYEYGRKYRSPICWKEVGDRKLTGLEILQIISEKVKIIRNRMKVAQDRYESYANVIEETSQV